MSKESGPFVQILQGATGFGPTLVEGIAVDQLFPRQGMLIVAHAHACPCHFAEALAASMEPIRVTDDEIVVDSMILASRGEKENPALPSFGRRWVFLEFWRFLGSSWVNNFRGSSSVPRLGC